MNKDEIIEKYLELFEQIGADAGLMKKVKESFKRDKEFISAAIGFNQESFKYVPEDIKADKSMVIDLVKVDGRILQYVAEELKSDRDVVFQAVENYGLALADASEELKKDEELLQLAGKSYGDLCAERVFFDDYLLTLIPDELLHNRTFLLGFINNSDTVLGEIMPKEFRNDKEIMKEEIKQHGYGEILYASSKLKDDDEIWSVIDESLRKYAKEEIEEKFSVFSKKGMEIPYNKIAKQALMNWNGMSEEEATEIITNSNFEKIESQVYAKSSIDCAISELTEKFEITDKEGLENYVISGTPVYIEKEKMEEFSTKQNKEDNVIQILSAVHDGWVKDNQKKFMAREKKHQHMPIELIGWKEAKADLLFVKPILESLDIQIDEKELENAYNNRVKNFFLDKKITNKEDLITLISKGEEFYPALEGQEDILNALKDEEFIRENVIPQIEENGIGNIEDKRKEIVNNVVEEFKEEDLSRLSKEERDEIESNLDRENEQLETEKETLTEKENSIRRIKEKMQKHKELQAEIAQIKRNEKSNEEYGG